MAFIELSDVSYSYESAPRPALDGISLSIEQGEYVAVVGANGSGKSTLLRIIAGLRRAGSGKARVAGLDASDPANARSIRGSVNLVFQSPPDQIVSTVVEEDVAFGPENLGLPREEVARRVDESLAAAGLESERKRPPHFLSAGQQQRLAVAGALAMRGSCLAFDEATAMLDPASREAMLDMMDGLSARGIGILHVTHDMAEAARARRVVALEEGRIVFDGTPEAYFGGPAPAAGLASLSAPPAALLARRLGLEPRPRESARDMASRIAPLLDAARLRKFAPLPFALAETDGGAGAGKAEDPAFSLKAVRYSYLAGTVNERSALESLDLELPRGILVALVGRTGSGKSTILQLLGAMAFPSEGRALSLGLDTAASTTDLRRLRTRTPVAMQRPESALFEFYAGDDAAYGPRNLGLAGRALVERVRGAMEAVGLPYESFRDRRTRSLSGGEARKLALAGIVALEPEALLLDEPSSALDPAAKRAVMDFILAQRRSGRTVVHATHSMEEAAAADLVALVDQKRITRIMTPREFFYEAYDPGWGLGRPFACDLAAALAAALGDAALPARLGYPLAIGELAEALEPLLARPASGGNGEKR